MEASKHARAWNENSALILGDLKYWLICQCCDSSSSSGFTLSASASTRAGFTKSSSEVESCSMKARTPRSSELRARPSQSKNMPPAPGSSASSCAFSSPMSYDKSKDVPSPKCAR